MQPEHPADSMSLHPYYLPRKSMTVIAATVYIPPSWNTSFASFNGVITYLQMKYPDAFIIIKEDYPNAFITITGQRKLSAV